VVAVLLAAVAGLIAADLISKYLGHPVHVVPAALARAAEPAAGQRHRPPERGLSHVQRTGLGNRIRLLVIGLILFAGGGLALVRGLAVWPQVLGPATAAITDKSTRHWVDDQSWFWPTVAAVAVLVFLLALRWIAVQGRTRVLSIRKASR
jgi:hypothetical protein